MAFGLSVFSASAVEIMNLQASIGRVVGYGVISFGTNEFTTKNLTIPGLVSTDSLIIEVGGNAHCSFLVSRSGETVTIQRTGAQSGVASTHTIIAMRNQ